MCRVISEWKCVVDSISSLTAMITMPASDVTVEATYKTISTVVVSENRCRLEINKQTGNGSFLIYDINGRIISDLTRYNKKDMVKGVYFIKSNNTRTAKIVQIK